jgi:hypothetical protein
MPPREAGAQYRLFAAHCIAIARDISEPVRKVELLDMAQAWIALAEQASKNSGTVLVYETPTLRAPKEP